MLTLPIRRKWFDMILTGEKKEEYREVKPYYTARFRKFLTLCPNMPDETVEKIYRALAGKGGLPYPGGLTLRNGYGAGDAALIIRGKLMIRTGRPEWGAEEGKEYYVLTIEDSEVLNPGWPVDRTRRKGGKEEENADQITVGADAGGYVRRLDVREEF